MTALGLLPPLCMLLYYVILIEGHLRAMRNRSEQSHEYGSIWNRGR